MYQIFIAEELFTQVIFDEVVPRLQLLHDTRPNRGDFDDMG